MTATIPKDNIMSDTTKDAGLDITRTEFERACLLLPPEFVWGLPVTPRLVLDVAEATLLSASKPADAQEAKAKAAEFMVAARNAQMFQDLRELISTLTDPKPNCPGRHLEAQRVLPLLDAFLGKGYTGRALALKRLLAALSDSGECESCADGKCVTGNKCVALGGDAYTCGRCKDTGYLPDGNHCQWCAEDAAPAQSAEPVAWVRYRSDGGFEGPIMDTDARMCDTRRGFWTPLYAAPQSAQMSTVVLDDPLNQRVSELLADHLELNLGNYDSDDVERVNDWGLRAHDVLAEFSHRATSPQPVAQPVEQTRALTEAEIENGWRKTFSTNNPYCPCNLKSFTKAARWAEWALTAARPASGETE